MHARLVIGMLTCAACLLSSPLSAAAKSGCCSWHGGVNSCDANMGRYLCNDGTLSPTCTCPEFNNATAKVKVQNTTAEDEKLYYRMLNVPRNTTAYCQSRFGKDAIAGKRECECKGGFLWNADNTSCIADGTKKELTSAERLQHRLKAKVPNVRLHGAAQVQRKR